MCNTKSVLLCKLQTFSGNDVSMHAHQLNRWTTLVQDADYGGDCACIGARGIWELSGLLFSFAANLKLLSIK